MEKQQILWDSITCLIIDDDKFSRTFIKTALHQIGMKNAKEATNQAEAIETLKNYTVDLILLDQQMPDKNGIEFAKDLRNGKISPETKDIPIIMITVDTQEKTVLDAKTLNIDEYLVKPISPLALKKRITTILNSKQ